MSGYRRYGYRRYGYGYRRRYYGRYRRYMSTARKANIAYRSTRKIVKRQEVKTREDSFSGTFLGGGIGSGIFSGFARVLRGTGEGQRIGISIAPTSLRLKIKLQADELGSPVSSNFSMLLRIIVLVWKGYGDPTISQILDSVQILSHKNEEYKYQSKILYDKVHRLDGQIQMKHLNITLKRALRRYPITYDDSQSSVAYRMNGLHIVCVSDPGPSVGRLTFDCTSRLCYKDS